VQLGLPNQLLESQTLLRGGAVFHVPSFGQRPAEK
jgi:hypothetical protein